VSYQGCSLTLFRAPKSEESERHLERTAPRVSRSARLLNLTNIFHISPPGRFSSSSCASAGRGCSRRATPSPGKISRFPHSPYVSLERQLQNIQRSLANSRYDIHGVNLYVLWKNPGSMLAARLLPRRSLFSNLSNQDLSTRENMC
jgi:hypothetical protein